MKRSFPPEVELIPCVRCWSVAELLPPADHSVLPRSRCVEGHEHSLAPAVLLHLRQMRDTLMRRETE